MKSASNYSAGPGRANQCGGLSGILARGRYTNCVFCLSGKGANGLANCCAPCAAAMPRLLKACRRCAKILEYSVAGADPANISIASSNYHADELGYLCPSCYAKPPPLDFIWSPYLYFPPLNRVLLQLKFQQKTSYAPALGYLWQEAYNRPSPHNKPEGPAATYDVILPMPLHRQRQNQRGFNQASQLIAPLAKQLGLPISDGRQALVLRSKATQPQLSLPPKERTKNLRNAFSINPKYGAAGIKDKKILIVDDIITSGASVFELARVLKSHGAGRVAAWTLLRA